MAEASSTSNARSRRFVFTFNNPTDESRVAVEDWLKENTSFAVFGAETGESGTPHLQGYFECKRRRLSSVRRHRFGGQGWHVDVAKGDAQQNIDYCTKGEQSHAEWELDGAAGARHGLNADVFRHGEAPLPTQGSRTDLELIRSKVLDGSLSNIRDLAFLPGVSYQGFKMGEIMLRLRTHAPSRPAPTIYWLFGASGTGKSRAVAEFIEQLQERRTWDFWKCDLGLDWFDGYCGQEIAWFDDFRFSGGKKQFAFLLQLFDRYHMRVPVKGSSVVWEPKFIFVTGPKDVRTTFASAAEHEDLFQVERRITRVFNFDEQGGVELRSTLDVHLE